MTPPASVERRYLAQLFCPTSIALIGASERKGSASRALAENLLQGDFKGECYAVNPNYETVLGRPSHPSVDSIGKPIDLAVIATPAEAVPEVMESCRRARVFSALILSTGMRRASPKGQALLDTSLGIARKAGIRILGPNSIGLARPALGLNAALVSGSVKPGSVALASQSGALLTSLLDWARTDDIGFSSIVSLGDRVDVGLSDVLDFLTSDPQTESILLYVEGFHRPRRFLSALRGAARMKPVIVVKAGRQAAGLRAAITHSGALVGRDDIFDAALRRAGAVRVLTYSQLFSAAKCLSSRYKPCGDRLAIVTNGGGPGVIAADWAVDQGIRVVELAPTTVETIQRMLPEDYPVHNPVDIHEDAGGDRYTTAVRACIQDPHVDGLMVIHTPQVMADPAAVAQAVIAVRQESSKPLITCWMGNDHVGDARQLLQDASIPVFRTPEPAVEAFRNIVNYYRNQQLLMQVPGPLEREQPADIEGARILVEAVLAERRKILTETESKALLAAFRIPVAKTVVARSLAEAIVNAEQLGFPVAMKISSPDIVHKSEARGVRLNVQNAQELRAAYTDIIASVKRISPNARVEGIAIQPMGAKQNGRELMVGVVTDPQFGPVISFGAGGSLVEVLADQAVALPPLNGFLARDLIHRTRIARTLGAYRNMPPANIDDLVEVLERVSEMVSELPWIIEMDINPLILDEEGIIAVDARVVVDHPSPDLFGRYAHMAIYPYPAHLSETLILADSTEIVIRPIRPEDATMEQDFVRNLSEESRYYRFISTVRELSQRMLVRFTQIDYDREMALVAVTQQNGRDIQIGVARYVISSSGDTCEFAIAIADDWQKRGIGGRLMVSLMEAAREKGLRRITGDVLSANTMMLRFMKKLGFEVLANEEDPDLKRCVRPL
ncbi:MAG: bifunctional acetate--CoA ligase family protein/GNAT family N-acetyltransferase [Burkholderiales bacterium]|nr:bifunctional acetate--CoA ligase family protein/GNAT family N-acetyltransferase [Burkholderiales bacterium]